MRGRATRSPGFSLALLAAVLAGAPAAGGPITVNSALTLSEGEFVFRQQGVWREASDDPTGAGRRLRTLASISVLGYGVDADLSVFAVLPYVDKRLKMPRFERHASGVGDVRLFGRYVLVRHNWRGRAFRLSPFLGVETPTGRNAERDGLGRLPPALQPGSGSWDPFGGIVATYQTLDFQIDGQLAYQANTQANNFEFGDLARADVSFQYRVWPRELSGGVPGFLYAVAEANLVHRRPDRLGGADNPNTGGTRLFLVPGLQYVTRRWVVEAAVQVPLIENLNGGGLGTDFVVRAGFRVNF